MTIHHLLLVVAIGVPALWAWYNARTFAAMWLHVLSGALSTAFAVGLVFRPNPALAIGAALALLPDIALFGVAALLMSKVSMRDRLWVAGAVLALLLAVVAQLALGFGWVP